MKKKYVKSLNEIWHERKRTVGSMLLLFAVVMVAIMGVRAVLNYVDFENLKKIFTPAQEEHGYSTLYNASRYFFRIYYPEEKWEVEGDTHGFLMDEESGLVAEMYPLIFADPVTPGPDADPKATAVVSFDKIRDPSLNVRFYYKEYTEEMLKEASLDEETDAPGASPAQEENDISNGASSSGSGKTADNNNEGQPSAEPATPAPATAVPVNTDIQLLDIAAEKVLDESKTALGALYDFSEMKTLKTSRFGYTLRWFTYTLKNPAEGNPGRKTDVYIIARSSNYIVITYEGIDAKTFRTTPESYTKYRDEFLSILNEFQLSVFSD